ncbi:hypothetical protein SAMN05216480_10536 [Pustulibacterium marinum]|uniref:Uncharacterized protein n=1 Tax=Pustulibacterium marinum TaxID=1224947 RepID=A0A1I7GKR7_9FLAO|nr:hypothetical protein [Pustulibacterium marinum]SFU49019.1 hypothetical protein SAMN05216480_10536 [Pustulibacterium marinum]
MEEKLFQKVFNSSLYRKNYIIMHEIDEILHTLFYNKNGYVKNYNSLEFYCPYCKTDSTFIPNDIPIKNTVKSVIEEYYEYLHDVKTTNSGFNEKKPNPFEFMKKLSNEEEVFIRTFSCARTNGKEDRHTLIYCLKIIEDSIVIIGRYPSIADTSLDFKKYKKIDKSLPSEFNLATGLHSHGVGAGAYVYLRRILEKYIIYPKLNEEQKKLQFFKEKLQAIKDQLPKLLVETPEMYSVLSLGIHELSEEECKKYYKPLESAILFILNEELSNIEQKERMSQVQNEIKKIHSDHKNKK